MHITKRGELIPLEGVQPQVGEKAPDFTLQNTKDETVSLENLKGQVIVLSVFPDINTRVCDQQTRQFNELAAQLPGVRLVSVSRNTKEELKNWCAANGIDMEMLHDDAGAFGSAYGLNMPSLNKLARSVFVIDPEGRLAYKEIVAEMTEEPYYEAVIETAKELTA